MHHHGRGLDGYRSRQHQENLTGVLFKENDCSYLHFHFNKPYLQWTGTTDAAWLQNPSGKSLKHIVNQCDCHYTECVHKHKTDPQCIQWDRQCNSDWREDCQNISRDLWPHLNITLEHYNDRKYGIAISWEQPGIKVIELLV